MKVRKITREEIEAYQRDGAVYLPNLLDQDGVKKLLEATDDRERAAGDYRTELAPDSRFFEERFIYDKVPVMKEYVEESGLAELAGLAMGAEKARILFDHLFVCEPNTPVDYYWHQDISYWPIDGDQICSIWLTLTDCNVDSSSLQIVKGSDKEGVYPIRQFGEGDLGDEARQNYNPEAIPEYHKQAEKYDILAPDMKAGDALLFNAKVMHSSAGNRTPNMRRAAYSIRYIGDDVVWYPRPAFHREALTPEGDLKPGDPFVGKKFPVLWERPHADQAE